MDGWMARAPNCFEIYSKNEREKRLGECIVTPTHSNPGWLDDEQRPAITGAWCTFMYIYVYITQGTMYLYVLLYNTRELLCYKHLGSNITSSPYISDDSNLSLLWWCVSGGRALCCWCWSRHARLRRIFLFIFFSSSSWLSRRELTEDAYVLNHIRRLFFRDYYTCVCCVLLLSLIHNTWGHRFFFYLERWDYAKMIDRN